MPVSTDNFMNLHFFANGYLRKFFASVFLVNFFMTKRIISIGATAHQFHGFR